MATNEVTLVHDDTGRRTVFASEAALEAAQDWYNETSKADLIAWYVQWDNATHKAPLGEIWADPDCTKLADDWANVVMGAYASTLSD